MQDATLRIAWSLHNFFFRYKGGRTVLDSLATVFFILDSQTQRTFLFFSKRGSKHIDVLQIRSIICSGNWKWFGPKIPRPSDDPVWLMHWLPQRRTSLHRATRAAGFNLETAAQGKNFVYCWA